MALLPHQNPPVTVREWWGQPGGRADRMEDGQAAARTPGCPTLLPALLLLGLTVVPPRRRALQWLGLCTVHAPAKAPSSEPSPCTFKLMPSGHTFPRFHLPWGPWPALPAPAPTLQVQGPRLGRVRGTHHTPHVCEGHTHHCTHGGGLSCEQMATEPGWSLGRECSPNWSRSCTAGTPQHL